MRNSVYATFTDAATAKSAFGALLDHGAKAEDISLVLPENYKDHFENRTEEADHDAKAAEHGITTTTAADAASGATKGAGIGFGVGALAALASILIPGVGLVVGGGALATAIAGAAATTAAGAVSGGVTGYLKDQGVSHAYIEKYSNVYSNGGSMITISVPSGEVDSALAEEILAKYGDANVEVWRNEYANEPAIGNRI